jgi:hypothetical protein
MLLLNQSPQMGISLTFVTLNAKNSPSREHQKIGTDTIGFVSPATGSYRLGC